MDEKIIRGVNCPSCGGALEIAEGTVLLNCQYCHTGLFAKGDRGIARFYVPIKKDRQAVLAEAQKWFTGWNKAPDLKRIAVIQDVFPVYVPFWRVNATVVGWVLGDVKEGSGKDTRYVPAEKHVLQKYDYTTPACDIGEFGVKWVDLTGDQVLPFDLEAVQKQGMTFDILTTPSEVLDLCDQRFVQWAEDSAGISRVTFKRLHMIRRMYNVIYYPLWIMRYTYKNRIYQITADAESGELLYGRAPGNNLYRVFCLIGCIAIANLILTTSIRSSSSDGQGFLAMLILCIALMVFGFRRFRYGGEIKKEQKSKDGDRSSLKLGGTQLQQLSNWKAVIERIAEKT
jgi:hypothetical protein